MTVSRRRVIYCSDGHAAPQKRRDIFVRACDKTGIFVALHLQRP
jgi:hypothetical protein